MGAKKVDVEDKDDACGKIGCCFVCVFVFIVIPASIVLYLHNTPSLSEPDLSSNIRSFSISVDDNSSTALCDVVLSLRKNKAASCKNLNLDIVMASVYYKQDRIWTRSLPPFGLPDREPIELRFNLTDWLPAWAAEDFRYRRVLAFDFLLEGIGSYDEPLDIEDGGTVVKVWCGHFKAEYAFDSDSDSDSAAIQLVHGPLECNAHIDNCHNAI